MNTTTTTKFIETDLEKSVKPKFYGVTNVELIRRANRAADFCWDDEAVEIGRRMRKSEGQFDCKMQGNSIVIISNNE